MPQITLNDEEAGSLQSVLEDYLSDLRMEIADTERMELRESLKHQEAFLKRVLAQLVASKSA